MSTNYCKLGKLYCNLGLRTIHLKISLQSTPDSKQLLHCSSIIWWPPRGRTFPSWMMQSSAHVQKPRGIKVKGSRKLLEVDVMVSW